MRLRIAPFLLGPLTRLARAFARPAGRGDAARPRADHPPAPPAPPRMHVVHATDRRAHARTPLDRGAMLELPGRRPAAVNLIDLSEGGAAVEWRGGSATPGTEGRLVIDTTLLRVRVAMADQGRIGLAFLAPGGTARAALRRIMREAGLPRAA